MNFDDAIAAHLKWKVRLAQFIDGRGRETWDSATAGKDHVCELGQWIHGDGLRYRSLAGYREMMHIHAGFHLRAAEIVAQVERNDRSGARAAQCGAYAEASNQLVATLLALKQAATREAGATAPT